MANNSFEKEGKSIFGEPTAEQTGASIESQKISLAEQILKHYWNSPRPFRKLLEHKQSSMELPTGDEAWRMLKIYIKFQGESLIPFPEKIATETGIPEKTVETLFELAKKENQG